MRGDDGLAHIDREIQAEKAAALLRIAGTLEELVAALQRVEDDLPHLAEPERDEARRRHRHLREQALRYRWYLEVQREAVGLTRHHDLDELYAIPPPLTPA